MTDVSGAAVLGENALPLVTLRLERYDPQAGRTLVLIVRLSGSSAVGFAAVGDWVEVVGRRWAGYFVASRGVNHTTHGSYQSRHVSRIVVVVAAMLVIVVALILAVWYFDHSFDETVERERQRIREQRLEQRLGSYSVGPYRGL